MYLHSSHGEDPKYMDPSNHWSLWISHAWTHDGRFPTRSSMCQEKDRWSNLASSFPAPGKTMMRTGHEPGIQTWQIDADGRDRQDFNREERSSLEETIWRQAEDNVAKTMIVLKIQNVRIKVVQGNLMIYGHSYKAAHCTWRYDEESSRHWIPREESTSAKQTRQSECKVWYISPNLTCFSVIVGLSDLKQKPVWYKCEVISMYLMLDCLDCLVY